MVDINDIIVRKEFYNLRDGDYNDNDDIIGYIDYKNMFQLERSLFYPKSHQVFAKNLFNPRMSVPQRLLFFHATGTGKTAIINLIANEYISFFKHMKDPPRVIIVSFTEKTITADLLKFPEFGYISQREIEELEKLKESDVPLYKLKKKMIKTRITDPNKGGYYVFYGYQKLAIQLFTMTPLGIKKNINIYDDIEENIKNKYITVNHALLSSFKNSLLICDEIHNTYNIKDKNNRGSAIKYVLDHYHYNDPMNEPRALFLSATPIMGSPDEIIDLMNLLTYPLDKSQTFLKQDFFNQNGDLLDGKLQKISNIMKGYVSFLQDVTDGSYPKKIIMGDEIADIPYLKFVKCNFSKTHAEIIKKEFNEEEETLTLGMYYLNDAPSTDVKRYKESSKYTTMMENILNNITGKYLIYHHYVTSTGVLYLKNMFLMNGFLDDIMKPLSSTRCSICAKALSDHQEENHKHVPCRVLVMYSDDLKGSYRAKELFNTRQNKYGEQYKVLIGSRIIEEGHDFNSVLHLIVLHPPNDINTLRQIIGRGIRRGSHRWMPPEDKKVHIYIYIHVFGDGSQQSPELCYYRKKVNTYVKIQQIEKVLRENAVDGFLNYEHADKTNSLDGIPYSITRRFDESDKIDPVPYSWYTHEYADIEVNEIIVMLKKMFLLHPVWIFSDIVNEIHKPSKYIYNYIYDTSTFSVKNIIIAINFLMDYSSFEILDDIIIQNPKIPVVVIGEEKRKIVYIEPYFILIPEDGTLDIDIFNRGYLKDEYLSIEMTDDAVSGDVHDIFKDIRDDAYDVLKDIDPEYHWILINEILQEHSVHINMFNMYLQLGIFLKIGDQYGYVRRDDIYLYDSNSSSFHKLVSTDISLPYSKLPVNETALGICEWKNGTKIFKIKMSQSFPDTNKDQRKINRGMICTSYSKEKRNQLLASFGIKGETDVACDLIEDTLFSREMKARLGDKKYAGKRWFTLFNEN